MGYVNTFAGDFIDLTLDISKEKLFLLIDTGANVSVIKSQMLIGSTEFEPQQKVRLKSVDGSVVEIDGLVKAQIRGGKCSIPMEFQLVNKQVDLEGDGILGKAFLTKVKAQICYDNNSVRFKWQNCNFEKKLIKAGQIEKESRKVRTIILPKRSETIVMLPVDCDVNQKEGLIEKCQIDTGIFVANSLSTVKNGYVVTSMLNTNDQEVTVPEPRLKLAKFETMPAGKKEVTEGESL
jgi:hypothetical protein